MVFHFNSSVPGPDHGHQPIPRDPQGIPASSGTSAEHPPTVPDARLGGLSPAGHLRASRLEGSFGVSRGAPTEPSQAKAIAEYDRDVGDLNELRLGHERLAEDHVVRVARHGCKVRIAPEAMREVKRGFELTLRAAAQQMPVYGLTVGTGWNKDQPVFSEIDGKPVVSETLLAQSREFNLKSLRSHAAGAGQPMSPEIVRAGMLIRLHTMLKGNTGAQPAVAQRLADFLNHDIVPVVPSCGTIGEADPMLASHIGLALCGEWEVFYRGERMCASEAMKQAGLEPIKLVGKDFLSILSTNALTAGSTVLGVHDAVEFLERQVPVFCMSLEGFDGNISPFLPNVASARPFPHVQQAAASILRTLEGSSLWKNSTTRALQDPISYRGMAYYLGECLRAVAAAKQALDVQINSTDDNPYIELAAPPAAIDSEQVRKYLVELDEGRGAIYPTAHFESLPFVAPIEQLLTALGKLSTLMTNNIVRLEDPNKTHLSRFLAAPGNDGHAFGGIQKTAVALNHRIQMLSTIVPFCGISVAGHMEDIGTTGELAAEHLHKITERLYQLASLQLLHAAQATDLRAGFDMSSATADMHSQYRKTVPFVSEDRAYTHDIERGVNFLKAWPVARQLTAKPE